MKILLDTSFLISAMRSKMDILGELRKFGRPELYVLDLVVGELESFAKGRGRKAINSRLSLKFLDQENAVIIKTMGGQTDRKIVSYATNRKMAVCTVDRRLKLTLVRRGTNVISIRQRKYLVLMPAQTSRRG
jgi:rRNA-processing protein FCF1